MFFKGRGVPRASFSSIAPIFAPPELTPYARCLIALGSVRHCALLVWFPVAVGSRWVHLPALVSDILARPHMAPVLSQLVLSHESVSALHIRPAQLLWGYISRIKTFLVIRRMISTTCFADRAKLPPRLPSGGTVLRKGGSNSGCISLSNAGSAASAI
jgi:hypothetical protein